MLDAIAGPDGLDPRQPPVSVTPSLPRLDDGVDGLRVGLVAEGFGIEGTSEAEVDEAVRSTAHALRGFGAEVKDTSVSMHRDGLNIWNAIVVQGCADLVFRGDGVGTNASGDNSTGLSDYFARVERELADHFPPTVKLTLLVAAHVTRQAHHHYYTQAQNLSRALRAAYDTALQDFDVLMLPTTAMRAFKRPPPDAPLAAIFSAALGNLHNVVSVNVTGHPALSVPVPHNSGPPIGCQIIGRHFDDATVLRVGKAVQAV
jgi:amidase